MGICHKQVKLFAEVGFGQVGPIFTYGHLSQAKFVSYGDNYISSSSSR